MMTVDYHIAHASLKPRKQRFYGMNSDRSGLISHNHVYLIEPVCWEDGQPFDGNWPKESPVRIFQRPFTLPRWTIRRIEREHRSQLKAAHKALITKAGSSSDEEVIREFNLTMTTSSVVAAKRQEWAAMSFEHYLKINEDIIFHRYATENEKVMGGPDHLLTVIWLKHAQSSAWLDNVLGSIRFAIQYYNRSDLLYVSGWRQGPLGPFELEVIKREEAQGNSLARTPAVVNVPGLGSSRPGKNRPPPRFSELLNLGDDVVYACTEDFGRIWLAEDGSEHPLRPMLSVMVRVMFARQGIDPGDMVNTRAVKSALRANAKEWGELNFSSVENAMQKPDIASRIIERPAKGFVRLKMSGNSVASAKASSS